MKVLSIKEPFATLIKNKKKYIETRSFKTNYRGELYIHASISNIAESVKDKKELMEIVNDDEMNYGYIICKCNLVNCIYMTEEYVKELKNSNYQEYICGHYEEGRYAWVLDDIKPLDVPIKAKGQLGIWNYYDEYEVMDLMNDIEYGWADKNNNKHYIVDETYSSNYILQSPSEVIKNKIGVCWDQVELERYYFRNTDYNIKTYFIVNYDGDKCPTHTFLTFEKNNKYYWFEHSWEKFREIHEYTSIEELLLDVKDKFIKYELNNDYEPSNVVMYEYDKPKYHILVQEFFNHCDNGKYINFDDFK